MTSASRKAGLHNATPAMTQKDHTNDSTNLDSAAKGDTPTDRPWPRDTWARGLAGGARVPRDGVRAHTG